jgi:hypothetical protein
MLHDSQKGMDIMTEPHGCPVCGQGMLHRVEFRTIQVKSYTCDECDTVWFNYDDIDKKEGASVDQLLIWLGRTPGQYQEEIVSLQTLDWPEHA